MEQIPLFPELDPKEEAKELVYCWYFRHWKTGKIIRAKDHPFCFTSSRCKR